MKKMSVASFSGPVAVRENLMTIFDTAVTVAFSIDLTIGSLTFSSNLKGLFGSDFSSHFPSADDFASYVHPDDINEYRKFISDILEYKRVQSRSVSFRVSSSGDCYKWLSVSYGFIPDEEGNLVQAIGFFYEYACREIDGGMVSLLSESLSCYLIYYDLNSNLAYASEGFRKDFRLPSPFTENAFAKILSFIPSEDKKSFKRDFNRLLSSDEASINATFRMKCPSKGAIHVSFNGVMSFDSDGKPAAISGSITDISDQVLLQQMTDLLIDGCSECVYVFNIEKNRIEFSKRILDITSLPSNIIQPGLEIWIEHILPEDRCRFLDSMKPIYEKTSDIHCNEYRLIGKDGNPVWISCRGKCAYDDGGAPIMLAGSITNISGMNQYNKYISELSMIECLTGLPNRLRFKNDLAFQLSSEDAHGFLIMLDIDDFHNVNSMFGLSFGDRLLAELAGMLVDKSAHYSAELFHFGGDVFMLNLRGRDKEFSMSAAFDIGEMQKTGIIVDNKDIRLKASIGVVEYRHNDPIDELITDAEIAVNLSKASSGDGVTLFTPELKERHIEQLELIDALRRAVHDGFRGFQAFYQPFYATATDSIIGAEALLRWNDGRGNVIQPKVILPALQKAGVLSLVESWMIKSAASQCRKWIDIGAPDDFVININLSPEQAVKKHLKSEIFEAIYVNKLKKRNLVFEITEESLIVEMQTSVRLLRELKESGINIAIDDFGTGYSSLSYLRNLPTTEMKIDRSFIEDIETDDSTRSFIASIIQLSHSMNYTVCVEGIETPGQMKILKDLGADLLQGYHFSRPLTAEEFEMVFLYD